MAKKAPHRYHKMVKKIVDKDVYNDARLKAYLEHKDKTCSAKNKHRLQASYGEGEPERTGYATLIVSTLNALERMDINKKH